MKISFYLAILCCVFAPELFADTVYLKNGGELEGVVRMGKHEIILEMNIGRTALEPSEILSIQRKRIPLHEFLDRYTSALKGSNVEDIQELILWAGRQGIPRDRKSLLRRMIQIDPNHTWARERLGYRRYNEKWMTESQIMHAKGFVKYKGKWMSTQEVEIAKTEVEFTKRKKRIAQIEEMIKKQELKNKQLEEARLIAETQKIENERRSAQDPSYRDESSAHTRLSSERDLYLEYLIASELGYNLGNGRPGYYVTPSGKIRRVRSLGNGGRSTSGYYPSYANPYTITANGTYRRLKGTYYPNGLPTVRTEIKPRTVFIPTTSAYR